MCAPSAPRIGPVEGFQLRFVLGGDRAAVFQGRHFLAWLVDVAFDFGRLGGVLLGPAIVRGSPREGSFYACAEWHCASGARCDVWKACSYVSPLSEIIMGKTRLLDTA